MKRYRCIIADDEMLARELLAEVPQILLHRGREIRIARLGSE